MQPCKCCRPLSGPKNGLELDPTIDYSRAFMQANLNQYVLNRLQESVIHELGGQVSIYHKSFADFLLDPACSGCYCVKGFEALGQQFRKVHLDYDPTYHWEGSGKLYANASL